MDRQLTSHQQTTLSNHQKTWKSSWLCLSRYWLCLSLRYFWNLIKQTSSFLTQTILRWACFWMLRAKQRGAREPWGLGNYSHIRYYFHNELCSQFIHFYYASLLYAVYQGCVFRLTLVFVGATWTSHETVPASANSNAVSQWPGSRG